MSEGNGYRPIDFALLPALEARVEKGLNEARWNFAEAGHALAEIRDGRYWAADHDTFEDYCTERWSISARQARRLMKAGEVVAILASSDDDSEDVPELPRAAGPMGPRTERVARELGSTLDHGGPEAVAETWQRAVSEHGPQPTAAQVRQTARGASPAPGRCERVLKLADQQRAWVKQLQRFIADELGDEPLPADVRRRLAVGAVQRARAAADVLDALAEGDAPDLDVLDAAPKFADESI